ncbi:MAG: hypothetical protein J3R72DRAFT_451127 [Linnemannia gamsii]|nr:MAG: hypothetical protein J3R72DRAFT_451127 [Linnemannia gamsii]
MKRESGIASATDESKKRRLEAPDATSSQATPIGNTSQYSYFYRDPNLHAYPFDAYRHLQPFADNTTYPSESSWTQPCNIQRQGTTAAVPYLPQLKPPQPLPRKKTQQRGSSKYTKTIQALQKRFDKAHQKKKGLAKSAPTPEATTSTTDKAPAPAISTTEKASAPATPTAISVSRTLPHHQELRTVYIGKIPEDTTMEAILDLVTTGNVEGARQVHKKHCAFVTFVDPDAAVRFLSQGRKEKWRIRNRPLELSWGNLTPVVPRITEAVKVGASRCVCVGRLDRTVSKEILEADFSRFGQVESLKLLVDKNVAYVYLTSIESAIKAKASLSIDYQYLHRRLSYGVDRCAQLVLTRMFLLQADKPQSTEALTKVLTSEGRRNVFLGNLYEDTTVEEICDVVTGGLLSFIKRQPKRKSAFVCFVDPNAAAEFVEHATTRAIKIKERTLKVGWGDDAAHRLPEDVINAFKMGATRTVYISNIMGLVSSRLKTDFAVFGEVEKVSICQDRNCAFINFSNVLSAVGAVQGIKVGNPEYEPRRIGFGRDRCARPLDGIPPQAPDSLDTQRPANIETLAKETVQKSDGSAASAYDPRDIAELEGSDNDMDMSE